ncbi:hypothetical protein J7J08_08060 [Stenotrophomonas sp. ISL-67]|uniref:hypothetical protein n=1 Tax=Stenotrophomonas sp. ISL-67 TaxID=2819171 RepID=UPI001BE9FC6C|nr:hypothetical protein [Stenotrophomonas sp. ISL-67]MBT2767591.1 hypothetical protein [Stenotrophomonas sp. ISL-67]
MLRIVCLGLVAAVGLGVTAQRAEAVPVRCDTCRDDGDFRAEAIKLGPGTHLVYNVGANVIQQYYIKSSTSGGGGQEPRAARAASQVVLKQTPPPAAVEELRRGNRVYVEGGMSLRPTYVVPVDVLGLNPDARSKTAYDYVRDQNLRAMVESATGNVNVITNIVDANVLTSMSDLVQMTTNYTGLRDQARLMFRVVFKDGSYVTVIVNLEHQNGESEVGSERTAAGQLIPADIQQVQGTWTDYGGENLGRMADHMASLGASMKYTGPTTSGFVKGITCSGSANGKTCVVEYMIR